MDALTSLKSILREEQVPYFTDGELEFYLSQNGGDLTRTAYQCLIVKSEDTTLSISGLSLSDSSKYFKRLAMMYRPNNTGTLKGGV